jgi:hypothetical protein
VVRHISMDHRVIGERSDAVLRTAMPGGDEGDLGDYLPVDKGSISLLWDWDEPTLVVGRGRHGTTDKD